MLISPDQARPGPAQWPARRRAHGTDRADGFTLVEVLVASAILALVMTLVLPQVVLSLRTTGVTRDISQSKGVAQAKLEEIRNQPFFVGRAAGDYLDILDTYYRDRTPPTTPASCGGDLDELPPLGWTGYVTAASTARCPWEPTGPFYRKVINPVSAPGLGVFAVTVGTQFLDGDTPPNPVAPSSAYNSQDSGADAPPANQVGVTVTVFYRAIDHVRYVTTYSQVARGTPVDPLIESAAKATTVAVSSATESGTGLSLNAGVINLGGEVFTGSRTVATVAGAVGSTSLGEQANGALLNQVAPDDKATVSTTGGATQLSNGCEWICLGTTKVTNLNARSSNGLPRAGTSGAPIRAEIPNNPTRDGFRFDNDSTGTRLKFDTSKPMVSLDTGSSGSMRGVANCDITNVAIPTQQSYLAGTGFLNSTAGASPSVRACATAQSNTLRLFPTSFAPNGVVQVVLGRVEADCSVSLSGSTRTRTARGEFEATVRYFNGSSYVTAANVAHSNSTDPLAGVNLAVTVNPAGTLTLGDYISSWRSLTSSGMTRTTTARAAEVSIPSVVSIITQPTREGILSGLGIYQQDPSSAISLNVGTVSCAAGDFR